MHFGLTEEQQMIVDATRAFVENELFPHELAVERSGHLPMELIKEIQKKAIEAYAANAEDSAAKGYEYMLAMSLAALVPPHVLLADLCIYHINNTGVQKTLTLRHTGTSVSDTYYMPAPNGEFDYRVTRALNASQQLDAAINSASNLYSIVVEGFREQI